MDKISKKSLNAIAKFAASNTDPLIGKSMEGISDTLFKRGKRIIEKEEWDKLSNNMKKLIILRDLSSLALILNFNLDHIIKGVQYSYINQRWPRNQHYTNSSNLFFLRRIFFSY